MHNVCTCTGHTHTVKNLLIYATDNIKKKKKFMQHKCNNKYNHYYNNHKNGGGVP